MDDKIKLFCFIEPVLIKKKTDLSMKQDRAAVVVKRKKKVFMEEVIIFPTPTTCDFVRLPTTH